MRADATRNREKLLDAAIELFAEQGTGASLEAVAARAGVGIGTLYRHFPTRDALVEAAYRSEVDHLCETASELLADNPADVALERWMERFLGYTAAKRGMRDALGPIVASRTPDLWSQARRQIILALIPMLEAGVEEGTIRSDMHAADVLNAMNAVFQVSDPEQARRLLRIVMDGLRHTGA